MFDFKIKVQSSKTVYTPEIKLCTLTMDGNAMLGQILKKYFRKLHNYIQNYNLVCQILQKPGAK